MWIDKWHSLSGAAVQPPQGIPLKKGKSGQDLINAGRPASIGLAYAIAFKMDKNSDKVQKLFSKWGKLD